MGLHEKLRFFRESKNWTQEEMAEKLGLSPSGYAKIEQGKSQPNVQRLKSIADVLGIDLFDLMPDDDNNMICLINEGDLKQGHNFYNGNHGLVMEIEKLQLQLQHASSLLAEKELMIEQLKSRVEMQQEMLDLLKKNS
ncbi:helix-turn-helix transcriptional regulator [Neisseria sp. Dent CA1/247]|uniref:helix-turn-helix domain-containing protein n=1 Tax=unclassified Neisseria TaxID=2623750 RepID=UPI0006DA7F80|nr:MULTISPECIES: helix-turn-helix transcriptional regulator [unclassified Neisseria]KPN72796.1 hypothetical protein AKG43_11430 [Neisseria sp. 74A18]UOO77366.1 helix-turn-helix transcriptional regulator [Neisseria sp. Dent CA1/247]